MDVIKWYFQQRLWSDCNKLTDKISLISRVVEWYDKRGGYGTWAEPVTQSTTFRFLCRLKILDVYVMCTLGRWEVWWETGRGGCAEPVSQSTNLQIFVQSECTLCTIWNTNSMRSTFCFHPSLHTFTPFISFQALPQFICTACTAFYINQQTL